MTDTDTDPLDETISKPAPRVGALVRSLLIDTDLDYEAILAEVRKVVPDAKTTVRSIASVASIARKKGAAVAVRRKPAASAPPQKVAQAKSGKLRSTLLVE